MCHIPTFFCVFCFVHKHIRIAHTFNLLLGPYLTIHWSPFCCFTVVLYENCIHECMAGKKQKTCEISNLYPFFFCLSTRIHASLSLIVDANKAFLPYMYVCTYMLASFISFIFFLLNLKIAFILFVTAVSSALILYLGANEKIIFIFCYSCMPLMHKHIHFTDSWCTD